MQPYANFLFILGLIIPLNTVFTAADSPTQKCIIGCPSGDSAACIAHCASAAVPDAAQGARLNDCVNGKCHGDVHDHAWAVCAEICLAANSAVQKRYPVVSAWTAQLEARTESGQEWAKKVNVCTARMCTGKKWKEWPICSDACRKNTDAWKNSAGHMMVGIGLDSGETAEQGDVVDIGTAGEVEIGQDDEQDGNEISDDSSYFDKVGI